MLTCDKCGCCCDNADLINGVCDDCRTAEQKETERKQQMSRMLNATEFKQMEMEDFA